MAERRDLNWREQPGEVRNARAALAERISLSRWALVAERFARAFWPLWTLVFLFASGVMFGAFAVLPAAAARLVLGASGLAGLLLLARGAWRFRWPSVTEAEARIDDALPGRPLAAMRDRQVLGTGDAAALRVWAVHLKRMADAALRAKTAVPDLRLARHDPLGLRLAGAVAIGAAVLFARGDGAASLENALNAVPEAGALATGPSFEAWANPPAYTGKPPIYLSGIDATGPLTVPAGTGISIRVYGTPGAVTLQEGLSGAATVLSQSAEGIQDAALEIVQAGSLVLAGPEGELASWEFRVTPDTPPTIRLAEPLSRAVSGATELQYAASDDYGVVEAWAEIRLDLEKVDRRYGLLPKPLAREPLLATLPLPVTGGTGEIAETLVEDFSKHPWAGLPVTITLYARDAADQLATADDLAPALPSRRFFDPLAAAIVEQRRDLLWSPENGLRVERVLKSATWAPQDIFKDNSAYLLVRTAIRRLGYAQASGLDSAEIDDLAEMLWVVALKIEDGDLSDAAEALRRAQDRLSQALEEGASDEEIAQLADELREAMQQYMQQMAREMMENGPEQQQQQAQNQQEITQDQLQAMLDEIQRLAESGQTEEAQRLLQQLQQMMENMQMTMQQGQQGQGQQGEGQQALQELQDMLRQQQNLADDAFRQLQEQFRQGRDGQPGQQGQQGQQGQDGQMQPDGAMPGQGMSPGELADRQEALRQLLEGLRDGMPGASGEAGDAAREALREAERNMGDARDSLEGQELGEALDQQSGALENLREGMRGLAEELQQQAQSQGRQPGEGMENTEAGRESRDPLGRPVGTNGSIFSDEQSLPGADALQRARALLDEIRKRAGEQARPKFELDYLKRLLERF